MQAAPARYVSVSELYSTDEVELLLDEIRDLEPTSCRAEDVQDFEIAGSGCGGGAGGGGRSPAGTEGTERSWDSHAHYRRTPPPRPLALAPLYCHARHLRSLAGLASLAVVACAAAAAAALWAAAGPRLPAPHRPLALAAVSSLLLHAALLAVRVSRLHRLMPLDWLALGAACCAWAALSLCAGASVLLHARPAARLPLAAAGLGYAGGAAALLGAAAGARRRWARGRRAARGPYRAVPTQPPPAPLPGPSAPL